MLGPKKPLGMCAKMDDDNITDTKRALLNPSNLAAIVLPDCGQDGTEVTQWICHSRLVDQVGMKMTSIT
jgi:hypothetical protein